MWPSRRISPSKQRYCVAWEEDGGKKRSQNTQRSIKTAGGKLNVCREAGGGETGRKTMLCSFCCRWLWIIKQWHKLSLVARLLYNPRTEMDSGCMTAVMFTKQNCSSQVTLSLLRSTEHKRPLKREYQTLYSMWTGLLQNGFTVSKHSFQTICCVAKKVLTLPPFNKISMWNIHWKRLNNKWWVLKIKLIQIPSMNF